jgi:hypothetical protein
MLRAAILERTRLGRGGGVGVDWTTRADLRRQLLSRSGRFASRGVGGLARGLVLACLMAVCLAAGAGGGALLGWNGQNSDMLGLGEAAAQLGDPALELNKRASAAGQLYAYATRAVAALREQRAAPDRVGTHVELYLRKLDRELLR